MQAASDAAAAAEYQALLAEQEAERQVALAELHMRCAQRAEHVGKQVWRRSSAWLGCATLRAPEQLASRTLCGCLQGVKEAMERAAREEMHLKQYEEQESVRFAAAVADQRGKTARLQAAIQQVPLLSVFD